MNLFREKKITIFLENTGNETITLPNPPWEVIVLPMIDGEIESKLHCTPEETVYAKFRKEGSTLERCAIKAEDYGEFEGIRIPINLSVTWSERNFTWYRLEITEVEYNKESADA